MLSKNGDANEQKKNCADARRTCAENATNVVCDLLNEFGTQTIHTGPVGVCVAHNNTQTREQPRADSTLHILALKSVWILMEFYRGSHVFCLLLLLTGWTFYKYIYVCVESAAESLAAQMRIAFGWESVYRDKQSNWNKVVALPLRCRIASE